MVMFCRLNNDPIEFRDPVEADFLGSGSRRRSLLPEHEVLRDYVPADNIITNADVGGLIDSRLVDAVGHWKLMRTVLPPKVWEIY